MFLLIVCKDKGAIFILPHIPQSSKTEETLSILFLTQGVFRVIDGVFGSGVRVKKDVAVKGVENQPLGDAGIRRQNGAGEKDDIRRFDNGRLPEIAPPWHLHSRRRAPIP